MKNVWLVLTAMVMTMAAGCRRPAEPRLAVADSLMATQPDSAFALLKAIDSRELNGDDQAYFALLYTAAQYKNYDPITSDSLIDIAVGHYRSSDDYDKWLRSMIFKGAALEETGDRLGAIEWYKKAEDAASPSDYENLGYINMRLGNLYMTSYIENQEDIEKYKNALRYYRLSGNRRYQQACLNNIGAIYRGFDMDSAYRFLGEAISLAEARNDSVEIFYTKGMLARAYMEDSQPLKAKDLAVYVIAEGGKFLTDGNPYYDAATAYVALGMVDSAEYYLDRSRRLTGLIQERVSEMLARIEVAKGVGDYRAAYILRDSVNVLTDSLIIHSRQKELFESEKRYDKTRSELEKLEIKQRYERLIGFCLIAGFFAVALFVFFFRRKRRQLRLAYELRDKIQNEHNYAIRKMVRQQNISDELRQSLFSQMDLMKEIIKYSYLFGNKANKFMAKFNEMVALNSANDHFWDNMAQYINAAYDNLLTKLQKQYPMLRDHELKFICMMICNFSVTEIMVCMGFTNDHSVSNKRLAIAKKMGIDISLEEFLNTQKKTGIG